MNINKLIGNTPMIKIKVKYIKLNDIQKKTVEITLEEVNGLIKLL